MRSLQVKGVTIGEGRPKTVVPIMDPVPELLAASAVHAVEAGADVVEWRMDFLDGLSDPNTLCLAAYTVAEALADTPLIATIRTKEQGGVAELEADAYDTLVRTLINTETADFVDIEYSATDVEQHLALTKLAHAHHTYVISSRHDFKGTPSVDDMVSEILRLAGTGADIAKLAVYAFSPVDACHLMEATALCADNLDCVLLTLAMGDAGKATRLVGEAFGSALTFCSLEHSSAPGQVELSLASDTIRAMHRALENVAR